MSQKATDPYGSPEGADADLSGGSAPVKAPPPLLLGAALSLWGWRAGVWPLGVAIGLLLEAARFSTWRWLVRGEDVRRIWDLCVVLLIGIGVWSFIANDGAGIVGGVLERGPSGFGSEALQKATESVLGFFLWIPAAFLPLAVAQAWGSLARIPLTSISWLARRQVRSAQAGGSLGSLSGPALRPPAVHFGYPYLALCLVSAGASNRPDPWFFWALAIIVAWASWPHRSNRFPATTWALTITVVVTLAFAGQSGITQLQRAMQESRLDWMGWLGGGATDALRARSAIGRIGQLKLSNRIVIQVEAGGRSPPPLLREASYEQFKSPSWFTGRRTQEALSPELDGTTWIIDPDVMPQRTAIISHYLKGGAGLLALPPGSARLRALPAAEIERTPNGAVRVAQGPGFVRFESLHVTDQVLSPSTPAGTASLDLEVPAVESRAVDTVLAELGIDPDRLPSPPDSVQRVRDYFGSKFQYSTFQPESLRSLTNQTPLGHFLLNTRSGHCEYFASATVLLLRRCGIPSRYTVGYSVHERSGKKYVVRERHAHAWATAFLGGRWQDIDTTPGAWVEEEGRNTPFWQPVADWFSEGWFAFSSVRWSPGSFRNYLLAPVAVLAVVLVMRIVKATRGARLRAPRSASAVERNHPGMDSDYYQLERWLGRQGWGRRPEETPAEWSRRVAGGGKVDSGVLHRVVALHYRLRFSPAGLGSEDRTVLRNEVARAMRRPVS